MTACGGDKSPGGGPPQSPNVVASTDVWGSVAQAVAGDHAKVTSIITSASADPHSFEASPANAAAIADASLVVYNGGGYDQWVDDILASRPAVPSVDAYSLLQVPPGEPQPANEHVFYDLGTARAVAAKIADKLAQDDPQHAADYKSNAETFNRGVDAIAQTERAIRLTHPGAAVVATEPVAHYLLVATGLTDKTPAGFASAVEQDTDPAPVDVAAMLDLITSRQVAAVVFNEQTETEVTKQVRAAAQSAGIPIVGVTETLPEGSDYLTWQRDTADRLSAALQQNR
ncbi:zinc ABC transporter substrate-binding protein [Mycobacterium sp. CVI_P3]|uniref:Zinc ABC transporter substrate-binding protein n=1 Tax=Mycobacterium pinniadriaticum TaxID=2994102 RepID=A0ABT3S6N0_9MYCO|nr:zinc ABC transporter substrate-binding protein [Mycobacterium pinniadriaticum]MCX2928983.1 zinc ABC transporter substrate-binding protein [Mycobacterium pinniadriaticum]MCX2935150.1 zinc ABC transporter substrate-binding protein [Mycobacterium pinniadriaticum]